MITSVNGTFCRIPLATYLNECRPDMKTIRTDIVSEHSWK
jgi:hypothetical protein